MDIDNLKIQYSFTKQEIVKKCAKNPLLCKNCGGLGYKPIMAKSKYSNDLFINYIPCECKEVNIC